MRKKHLLNENWQFSLQSKIKNEQDIKFNKWYEAVVPGSVYHNLLLNKLIPDPFFADNELKLQWIAEADWNYRTAFNVPKDFNPAKPVTLLFEGIDTAADIYLNGNSIGNAENMFTAYSFDISGVIKKKNTLEVKFTSPYKYARALEDAHGKLPVALASERVYIRKAQYSFGWDWGPAFADMGLWKPVYIIQEEENFIESFCFNTVSVTEDNAYIELNVNLNKAGGDKHYIHVGFTNKDAGDSFVINPEGKKNIKAGFEIKNPKLWWPNGEGEQNLYDLKLTLFNGDYPEDELIKKSGIRKVELQLKDGDKNSFGFIVNGRKIFARGCNWIPADSFLTRVENKKYAALLSLAKSGNMNFIRVWGGGTYEQDTFYNLCDELGLLVWQDFMFACASYPEYDEFLSLVKKEVEQNVLRLQYHPCIAIWCGNNENEWIWYQEQKLSYKQMPGYKIYSSLIPSVVKDIDPLRPYWESSPFSFEEDPNSVTSGNRHQWDLWSRWIDYNSVKDDKSLFVTEFGFQGPANQSTFGKVIPEDERFPQSYLFEYHNKQVEGNERQFKFLSGHLPVRTEWKNFIYLAQLSQGLALKMCVEQWRYNFPACSGSVIWQLNDCWPVSSWALVDSDLKPKTAYYLVKQAFNQSFIKFIKDGNNIKIALVSNSPEPVKGWISFDEIKLPTGNVINHKKIRVTEGNKKQILMQTVVKDEDIRKSVFAATLYDESNNIINRNVFAAAEWKHLTLPDASVKTKVIKGKKGSYVTIRSDKPAFFVSLYGWNSIFENNCITVLPGEQHTINITDSSKSADKLNVFSLNSYLNKK